MRNYAKRAFGLMLVLCMVTSSLPYMGKAETAKTEAVAGYAGSEDIVHGFGSKIKDKKQKNEKFKVNKEEKNGKAWNQQMIQAELPQTSKEVIKVAIIDSGINFSTDLNVVERKNFIPDDERSVLYEDPTGHGTAVAGIIGALDNEEGITGVNPGVELYSARVLDEKLEAPVERIVEAIDWVIGQDVDIINMSFGIAKNVAELEAAIEKAAEAGILLIAASGDGDEVAYPAAYDEVIAVGSVTAAGTPAANSANGEALELMAPGENILSSGIFGGTMGASGTSMAAPHVVGVASVLMELNPDMPAEYIRALLNYSANLCGDSNEYGNGVIDLEYAIEINDEFRKLYKENITKDAKSEKQKEKQKDKFWGEVLKTIPGNDKVVETFTEVEVVEGMWNGTEHGYSVSAGIQDLRLSFTAEQMKILVYASKYPDDSESGLNDMDKNPYHGFLWNRSTKKDDKGIRILTNNSNYISNYITLTRLAKIYGSVANFTSRSEKDKLEAALADLFEDASEYMIKDDIKRMQEDFTVTNLGVKTWEDVFEGVGENVEVTPENVELFIYGIAIHSITDIYAHSAWKQLSDGSWIRIKHPGTGNTFANTADDYQYIPMRYVTAKEAAKNVLAKAYKGQEGNLYDFVFPVSSYSGYYLGNFAPYAQKANPTLYKSLQSYFTRGDLASNTSDYNYDGYDYYTP